MGGASISDGWLLELLQAADKYCCWFPSVGTLDLKVWEKVGAELKKERTKGTPLPVSIWSTWALIKSVLESLQTSDSFDESDDDSFEKPQNQHNEASRQIMFNQYYIRRLGLGKNQQARIYPLTAQDFKPLPPLFSLGATDCINLPPPTPIPLNWKTGQPVWIEQWPPKQEKLEALLN